VRAQKWLDRGQKSETLPLDVVRGWLALGQVIWVNITLRKILYVKDEHARVLFCNTANKPLLSHKHN
jgi:hypothetical protein